MCLTHVLVLWINLFICITVSTVFNLFLQVTNSKCYILIVKFTWWTWLYTRETAGSAKWQKVKLNHRLNFFTPGNQHFKKKKEIIYGGCKTKTWDTASGFPFMQNAPFVDKIRNNVIKRWKLSSWRNKILCTWLKLVFGFCE